MKNHQAASKQNISTVLIYNLKENVAQSDFVIETRKSPFTGIVTMTGFDNDKNESSSENLIVKSHINDLDSLYYLYSHISV